MLKKSLPATDTATFRLFWRASLRYKREFLLASLHPLGVVCMSMAVPFFIGKILASLGNGMGDPNRYIPYLIGVTVFGLLANRIGFTSLLIYQAKTISDLQNRVLDVLLRRSVGFHNNNMAGKLVSDAIDFPNAFSGLFVSLLGQLLPLVITLFIGSAIVFTESWQLGLILTAMATYAIGSGIYESHVRSPLRKRRLKASKAVTGHLADTILNVQAVKTFGRENAELNHHQKLNDTLREHRLSDWRSAALSGNNRMFILSIAQIALIAVIVHLVQQDPSLLAIGIFAFSFTITLSLRLFEVNTLMRTIEEGFLQASPMTEILLADIEVKDKPNAKQLRVQDGAIEIRNVHFHYTNDNSKQTVFSELNLSITPGEKIGVVGPSGGGKSTLTRLLLRFEDIDKGVIAIDGQDIASVTQVSLREAVAYVPQEPLLFHRSIAENIAYGNPKAGPEKIAEAASMAHADSFIRQLSEGYDTIVGERGVKLSGGQRQRIAIARAILKDAPILVLDEATSALDSESEILIQDALWKLMEKRTAIVIAHRLSTIQKMDRIIVLDEGTIVEQGTHAQLLKSKGTYAKLWAHQSGGFLED